jgi:carboxypeptidase Taq
MKTEVTELITRWGEFEDVTRAAMVLEWDQETYLPKEGARARGNHIATLARVAHERISSPGFRTALKTAERLPQLSPKDKAVVREARREHLRASKIPTDLVVEVAKAESAGVAAWKDAYRASRWQTFSPHLATLVRLKRRVAEAIGYRTVPYDALLDIYEPGTTSAELDLLFGELEEATVKLVQAIARSSRRPNTEIWKGTFPEKLQLEFGRTVVEAMGFDFTRGRIDLSVHPFCSGFDPSDVRLTTRVSGEDLRPCLFGLIHEAGHGLYEQGIDPKLVGTPLGHAVSNGIHESQSRLWENIVGRSRPFWRHFLPKLKRSFPALARVKLEDFHFAVNEARPSYIRVDADEVTYNLHVILRYQLEKGLIDGSVRPESLPELWNAKMKKLLGITPKGDSQGVLQDIHWASGNYGYFPSYTLGNLCSAQIFERAAREIPDLDEKIGRGELVPLRDWLRRKIHQPGRLYPANELMRRATGRTLSAEPFLRYVNAKYGELYAL